MVRMAKCCNPVPGDDIIGYITRGRGVSVHRSDCTSLGHTPEDLERMIEVSWDEASSESFHVGIDIQAYDRSGIPHGGNGGAFRIENYHYQYERQSS